MDFDVIISWNNKSFVVTPIIPYENISLISNRFIIMCNDLEPYLRFIHSDLIKINTKVNRIISKIYRRRFNKKINKINRKTNTTINEWIKDTGKQIVDMLRLYYRFNACSYHTESKTSFNFDPFDFRVKITFIIEYFNGYHTI